MAMATARGRGNKELRNSKGRKAERWERVRFSACWPLPTFLGFLYLMDLHVPTVVPYLLPTLDQTQEILYDEWILTPGFDSDMLWSGHIPVRGLSFPIIPNEMPLLSRGVISGLPLSLMGTAIDSP